MSFSLYVGTLPWGRSCRCGRAVSACLRLTFYFLQALFLETGASVLNSRFSQNPQQPAKGNSRGSGSVRHKWQVDGRIPGCPNSHHTHVALRSQHLQTLASVGLVWYQHRASGSTAAGPVLTPTPGLGLGSGRLDPSRRHST